MNGTTPTNLAAALSDRYRIERELGAGGMATVYLAHDLKHDRNVAIKVLKPELAAVLGADRFVVEIRTTASLQHPHILPLFDSGTAGYPRDGAGGCFLYYVMPYIEGETVREKLNRETQFPVDEAVRIAREVADALDYAHRHGVIHRDIKPENILLHDGRAMVMDFGIALAVSAAAGGRMTETGLSLGTPHYMSPEQATAEKDLTPRSDIYSLGSVLYEMLAGQPPHLGGSAQQIIMKIITESAQDVMRLRKSVPPNVGAAVAKALEKVPADRFDSAKAFGAALQDPHFTGVATALAVASVKKPGWRTWARDPRSVAALVMLAVLGALAATRTRAVPTPSRPTAPMRFTIIGPEDSTFVSMMAEGPDFNVTPIVSPDDRYVAFSVETATGSRVYLRALDSFELIPIGDDRSSGVFFSPDGSHVGFMKGPEVWAIDVADRTPSKIGTVPEVQWDIASVTWQPDGRIFVAGARGLWTIPSSGGEATLLVATDATKREHFLSASVLPDGRILTSVGGLSPHTEVLSSDGKTRTPILPGVAFALLVDDILFFGEGDQQRAARFDLRSLRLVGPAVTLPPIATWPGHSIAQSPDDRVGNNHLVWVTPTGAVTPLGLPADAYRWPRLSPDGGRVALQAASPGTQRLHVLDLTRRAWVSLDGGTEPVWTPDGRHVIQSIDNRPNAGLVIQVADGSRPPDTLMVLRDGDSWPTSVSHDGAWLAWYGVAPRTGADSTATDPGSLARSGLEHDHDVFFMQLATRQRKRLQLPGNQRGGRFSPDGRYVAYSSEDGGRSEVHVRPWPALDARYVVSAGEGEEPAWSPDGGTLYYRRGREMMAVTISARAGVFESSAPRVAFTGSFRRDRAGDQSYDIAPDGRFLMLQPVTGGRPTVEVTLNWIAEVRARLDRAR